MAGQRNTESSGLIDRMNALEKELSERRERLIADLQAINGALQAIKKLKEEDDV